MAAKVQCVIEPRDCPRPRIRLGKISEMNGACPRCRCWVLLFAWAGRWGRFEGVGWPATTWPGPSGRCLGGCSRRPVGLLEVWPVSSKGPGPEATAARPARQRPRPPEDVLAGPMSASSARTRPRPPEDVPGRARTSSLAPSPLERGGFGADKVVFGERGVLEYDLLRPRTSS